MIVRQFLHWIRNAPAGMRAEATGALTRAYLFSDLSEDDRAAAEGAMLMLLDDPSPLVRLALAEGLADSPYAPPAVVHALANDQPEIATLILEHSVLFIDADLVEIVATGNAGSQAAVARQMHTPRNGGLRAGIAGRNDLDKVGVDEQHRVFKNEGCDFRLIAGERMNDGRWSIRTVGQPFRERETHQRRRIVEQHEHRAFRGGTIVF